MKSSRFDDYQHRWRNIRFEREGGVLLMTLHTEGESLLWGAREGCVHDQLGRAWREISRDADNRVLILTGSGAAFCAGMNMAELPPADEADSWRRIMREGQELMMALADLDIPVIAAVNGPALIHAQIPAMSDIVLASSSAVFADVAHILGGVVPGDGAHVIWPLLLGPNRGRYFLLTGRGSLRWAQPGPAVWASPTRHSSLALAARGNAQQRDPEFAGVVDEFAQVLALAADNAKIGFPATRAWLAAAPQVTPTRHTVDQGRYRPSTVIDERQLPGTDAITYRSLEQSGEQVGPLWHPSKSASGLELHQTDPSMRPLRPGVP